MTKEEKCRNSQKGRVVIHKDDIEKRIYSSELNNYLAEGWIIGMTEAHKKNNSKPRKNNYWVGREKSPEQKRKISETLKKRNQNNPECGWRKYWQTDHVVWNKGLKKETNESVAKISKSKLGHQVSDEARAKISKAHKGKKVPEDKLYIQLTKQYLTKKKNNSFNKSKPEEEFYTYLLKENTNKTIFRQYKDERYPFYCDFYIKEDDLFIECNFHWTHGGHPFDKNNPLDIAQLNEWKQKAETSKFYQAAIETWTIRDVKKKEIAAKNKLNIKILY